MPSSQSTTGSTTFIRATTSTASSATSSTGGDTEYSGHLARGLRFYKDHFIEASGRPRYYHDRAYPIDIQCAAQAIDTLAYFAPDDPEALALAVKVAGWTMEHMQDGAGFFYFRKYPLGITARTPMLHWGQGRYVQRAGSSGFEDGVVRDASRRGGRRRQDLTG